MRRGAKLFSYGVGIFDQLCEAGEDEAAENADAAPEQKVKKAGQHQFVAYKENTHDDRENDTEPKPDLCNDFDPGT